MNKRKLKGFTLVELILVMAIFAILMAAIMSIINPLNRISKRASLQEANAAAVDNVKIYLESSLRYAECIEAFPAGLTDNAGKSLQPGSDGYDQASLNAKFGVSKFEQQNPNTGVITNPDAVTPEQAAVINFIDNHYCDRALADENNTDGQRLNGIVRMLKIDNANGGKITEYEYDFTAGYTFTNYFAADTVIGTDTYEKGSKDPRVHRVNATVEEKSSTEVINPAYYENYSFYITPGYNKMETIDETAGLSGFDTSDDTYDDYYSAMLPLDKTAVNLSKELFSLSILTYKNDTRVDESNNEVPAYRGTYTNSESEVYNAFKSPFALSSANMSLVNINTDFGKSKWDTDCYGPVRYYGKPKDSSVDYKYDTAVADDTTGNWLYTAISTDQAPKVNYDDRLFTHAGASDASDADCIYFIYTLPSFK